MTSQYSIISCTKSIHPSTVVFKDLRDILLKSVFMQSLSLAVCFQVVCSSCSDNKAPLEYLRNKPARVCNECFQKLHTGTIVCFKCCVSVFYESLVAGV